eukprot:CAMPEP_0179021890 /NCGR_PEP_ID=MMETSP0796-20121207/6124_1 /TAXON_ID=73915 /ORGANISM="Pyrodinium bahamense, Strain pbaha01" /LENGTH=798 /DNA_ID=CAMNT_0020717737 /DNA_START=116 /DNA_END=2512 /DNA_ORIENTATION=-
MTALLTALWYSNNKDAAHELLAQNRNSGDVFASACNESIDSLATGFHAVIGEVEVLALRKFLSEPHIFLQNSALLAPVEGSGPSGAEPGVMDTNLKLMFWQLSKALTSLEGVFYADLRGVYAEYERLSHHASHGSGLTDPAFTLEYHPGDGFNLSDLRASCPTLCPSAQDLLPSYKSTFEVNASTGVPLSLRSKVAVDVRQRPWFTAAVEAGGQAVWDGPRAWEGVERIRVVRAQAERGRVTMLVGADFTLDYLDTFLNGSAMARTGLVVILDKAGRIISSSDGKATRGATYQDAGDSLTRAVADDMIRRAGSLSDVGDSVVVYSLAHGPGYIYSHKLLQSGPGAFDLQWVVVNVQALEIYHGSLQQAIAHSRIDVAEAQSMLEARLDQSVALMVLVSMLFLLIEAAVIFLVAQAVTRPLQGLQDDMRAVARLQFDIMDDMLPVEDDEGGGCHALRIGSGSSSGVSSGARLVGRAASYIQEIADIRDSFAYMAAGLRSFSRYMDPSLVRMLVQSGREARLGVARATVTVFFSDIVGFTTLAESMDPKAFMNVLGEYLDEMSSIIMSHGGVVGEFIGDAIMAWWNTPEELGEGHSVAALTAALQQQTRLAELRGRWAKRGLPAVHARMGLARGPVLAGNIGSHERMKYGLVGDTVNLASRMEGLCKLYGVDIMLDDVAGKAPGVAEAFFLRPLGVVRVKGRSSATELFQLVGLRADGKQTPSGQEGGPRGGSGAFCDDFAAALSFYRAGSFAEAAEALDAFGQYWPDDKATQMLKQRCTELLANPPDKDWSPVELLSHK